MMNHEPSEDGQEEDEENPLTLPNTMKVMGPDGQLHVEKLAIPDQVSCCCSHVIGCFPAPPMGWTGPFGLFRLIAYAFIALMALSVVMMLAILISYDFGESWFSLIGSVLLFLAAGVATAAAYSHEGLANQVTEMSKQNDRFAEKNERFAKQLNSLASVDKKLQDIGGHMGQNLSDLEKTLNALNKCAHTAQLNTILRAFTSADSTAMGGDKDMVLKHDEVDSFFMDSSECFKQAAPEYDMGPIKKLASTSGTFDLNMMRIFVMAVIAGGDSVPGKTTALLTLVAFSLDPGEHLDEARDEIAHIVAGEMTKDEVREQLQGMVEDPDDPKAIPCADLVELAEKVFQAEPSNDGKKTRGLHRHRQNVPLLKR
eukprot:gnl/TRDRNA2_/TRDRNA2_68112_c0_seq1.p1 gnl/TRDRNA2_/TRDRNA2_68112_c0~~gnl/TRDRNA2_/TRDRNA2_68112_c0_seq1.p1  ORF type:complete len:370 (+),score=85.74 gnl/TRDRNA2_/TRDRNA2_68112_c0_seq1:104-1213(+)